MSTFRILALDGGGLLGAFSASVLVRLEELCGGRRIVDHFDLITGTSTGGIIAVGLAMGVPASEILDFYHGDGPKIFPKVTRSRAWVRTAATVFRPKYRAEPLRRAIRTVVGNARLREAHTRLVVPAYEASPGRVYVFKSPHADPRDAGTAALDVALATSAAPTYFPAHVIPGNGGTFIDGGIWANCPAVVGIIEAVRFCGKALSEIDLLSVGTTSYPFRIHDAALSGGYFGWASQVIDTFMFGQVHGSIAAARCFLGDRFLRIDADAPPKLYEMDDAKAVGKLVREGRVEAEKLANWQAVARRFLNGEKVTPFSPVTDRVDLRAPAGPPGGIAGAPGVPPPIIPPPPAPPSPERSPSPAGSTLRSYRQRLVVYVVWHPKFPHGKRIADALCSYLNPLPVHPGGGGLGIPVYFRSRPKEGNLPPPIDFSEARNIAVVVLVDDEIVAAPGWSEYVEALWEGADAAGGDGADRVFPVQLSPNAFNLSGQLAKFNFLRPIKVPAGGPLTADRVRDGLEDAWDVTLTRLRNDVVHELCRLLKDRPRVDHEAAHPAPLPAAQKVTIFLSHTKVDGVDLAGGIKAYIQDELQLGTFFDANDIDFGAQFDPVLRRAVGAENAALLVIQTDAYSGSVWCLEELLEAKKHRRPVLVVNAVAAGEERAPVYAGNVPTRRHSPDESPHRYDRIVGRMLLEVLRRDHFVQHFEDVQGLFGLPRDIEPLPYPPEPLTLADLRAGGVRATRFVYPDPPLSSRELERLQHLDDRLTLTTPLLLLATGARSADRADPSTTDSAGPTPRLEGTTVGLSVGNSPDLAAAGLDEFHLNEATITFARYLLACGADLAYGGLPSLEQGPDGSSPPNFLHLLLEMVLAHRRLGAGERSQDVRLTNFVAEVAGDAFDANVRARWKPVINLPEVPAGVPRPAEGAPKAEHAYFAARSFTAMREEMNRHLDARVLLGGKSFGFMGKYPGVVEEAYLAMAGPGPVPVYLIGAFGGAARAVIDALLRGPDDPPVVVLTRAFQEEKSPAYRALAAVYDREAAEGIDYDHLSRFFAGCGIGSLSEQNGLTEAENRRLFVTPHVVEMVYLVLLGLGRLRAPRS